MWLKVRELLGKGEKTTDGEIFGLVADELKAAAGVKKTSHITASTVKRVYYDTDRNSLESLISITAMLRRLGSEAEAKA